MLKDIKNCSNARLYTIHVLALEGIKWAGKHPQLKEIRKELRNRNLI